MATCDGNMVMRINFWATSLSRLFLTSYSFPYQLIPYYSLTSTKNWRTHLNTAAETWKICILNKSSSRVCDLKSPCYLLTINRAKFVKILIKFLTLPPKINYFCPLQYTIFYLQLQYMETWMCESDIKRFSRGM